mgnify:CR=1 FL=1
MSKKKTIRFEIVTPERIVLKEDITQVTVPTRDGEITVLPKHIPLISILKPGVIEAKKEDDALEVMSVSGGFIEVLRDKVIILADTAERAEEIDIDRAEEARKRAEETKKNIINKDDIRFANLSARMEVELARTKAVKRWKRIKSI